MGIKKSYQKSKKTYKVTFTLSKSDIPGVESVVVVGDFNSWDRRNAIELKKQKKWYSASVELEGGRDYEYRYILNGQHWYNDPEPDGFAPSPYMGSLNCLLKLDKVEESSKKSSSSTKKSSTKKATPKKASAKKDAAKKSSAKKTKATPKSAATSRAKTPKTTAKKVTAARTSASKVKSSKRVATAAKVSVKDNLKRIEGIGPKIEQLLNAKNIKTFDQLSSSSLKKLQSILDDAGSQFKKFNPENWVLQAKLATQKKWDELKKLQQKKNLY